MILAPWRAGLRTLDDAATALVRGTRQALVGTAMYAAHRAAMQIGITPSRQVHLVSPRTRGVLRRTTLLAVLAAGLGVVAASAIAGAWQLAGFVPPVPPGLPYGALAAVGGGIALCLAALFRVLGDAVDGGLSRQELSRAIARAVAALIGWSLAWLAGAGVAAIAPGLTLNTALAAASPPVMVDVAGWTVAWVLYGAVGGAMGTRAGAPRARWLFVGATFGFIGWAVALATWLLA
jgi:hypothetical protein